MKKVWQKYCLEDDFLINFYRFVNICFFFYFVGASFDLHFNLISTSLPLNYCHIAEMQVKTK